MATKTTTLPDANAALVAAIAKAQRHPNPEGFAALVMDIMAGKEIDEETVAVAETAPVETEEAADV